MDYKSLKKIISSLAAHRPASEAALTVGVHPRDFFGPRDISQDTIRSSTPSADEIPFFASFSHDDERGADFQAHKTAFFFKLERELEKVSHANLSSSTFHRQSPSRSMHFTSRRKQSSNSASRLSSPSEEQQLCMLCLMSLTIMPRKITSSGAPSRKGFGSLSGTWGNCRYRMSPLSSRSSYAQCVTLSAIYRNKCHWIQENTQEMGQTFKVNHQRAISGSPGGCAASL